MKINKSKNMQNQESMASSNDIRLNDPVVHESGTTLQDAYKQGQREMRLHYRALLRIFKEHVEGVKARHQMEVEFERLQAKLQMLDKVEKVFGPVKEKQRLICELGLAHERMLEVKVPNPDWCKLGEAWLDD